MKTLLNVAIRSAIEAGNEIIKIYNTDFNVEMKEDDSPLTIADKKANHIINQHLSLTDIPIISEENKQIDYEIRKNWNRCWIVDPLDGTKEFIKRNGEFTVNIALVENEIPILGVIYVPLTKTIYFGLKELGVSKKESWTFEAPSTEKIIENAKIIRPVSPSGSIKIVGSRSHLNLETKEYVENLKIETRKKVELVSIGSSLKFCLVAEGKAHIYPRFAPTMEWDTAAGDAICRVAGIGVIDQQTQKPMIYNKPNLLNNHFLVSV